MTEHPEDEQQADDQEPSAPEEPEAEEPVAEAEEPAAEPTEEPVAESAEEPAAEPAEEPVAESAEEPAAEEPVAEPAEEPVAEPAEEAVAEPADEPAIAAEAEEPPAEADEPAIAAEAEVGDPDAVQPETTIEVEQNPLEDEELEEIELTPRQKPEIPGADLIPDIVSDSDQFLDAEAQAAAEADAEAAAARAQREAEEDSSPIADAAIDLAAGARYTATGKRKTAVARVIIKPGTGTYVINGKTLEAFFPRETLRRIIRLPLETVGYESRMDVVARMHGGGVSAQAGALRHGISRALIVADPNLRGELKRRGFLTRDPRVKERKKAGLKKARKRPQFSKR